MYLKLGHSSFTHDFLGLFCRGHMHVCMNVYVCICVCMHAAQIYACVIYDVCTYVCVCVVHVYICLALYIYIYIYIYIYMATDRKAHTYIHMYVCMYVGMYTYLFIHGNRQKDTYITYICMYVRMYVAQTYLNTAALLIASEVCCAAPAIVSFRPSSNASLSFLSRRWTMVPRNASKPLMSTQLSWRAKHRRSRLRTRRCRCIMYVCMYVCMHVCMYVCMGVCMCVWRVVLLTDIDGTGIIPSIY